jgi:hypothetical protein
VRLQRALLSSVTHQALGRPPVFAGLGHVMETGCSALVGPDVIAEGRGSTGAESGGLQAWLRTDELPLALKAQ